MSNIEKIPTMNLQNYKGIVSWLTKPYKKQIAQATINFRKKIDDYQSQQMKSVRSIKSIVPTVNEEHKRSPTIQSDFMFQQKEQDQILTEPVIPKKQRKQQPRLREWQANTSHQISNHQKLAQQYQQIFLKKKLVSIKSKNTYDFRSDQKEILVKLFQEIKTSQNQVTFEAVKNFFDSCKLFYLCYNIKPFNLIDTLKDFAHRGSNSLTLNQFLNVFFFDRPNLTSLAMQDSQILAKQCILNQDCWNQIKSIFNTLDTFGNETVAMTPFFYKIKNNYSNVHLINEPTIAYKQIGRTIPLKKIIFNLQNRHTFKGKVKWEVIEDLIKNFKFVAEPSIDQIYNRQIKKGQISKFSNYFMLSSEILQQIKSLYHRCPKYCEYFVKTKFICGELLQSRCLKQNGKQFVVRIKRDGNKQIPVSLQEQIRHIAARAQKYIDLDELLEYFSIKGPINTSADLLEEQIEEDSDAEQEHNTRLMTLSKIKSQQILADLRKSSKGYKPVRHLTVCQQFKLSKKTQESTMERKTRQWKQSKQKQIDIQLSKKFKANPIPADLNAQRYQQYVNRIEQQKIIKRQQFQLKRHDQNRIYQYLKSNTSLFNKKTVPEPDELPKHKFSAKPVPWFMADTNMLAMQQQRRLIERKKILAKKKIQLHRTWTKLPDIMRSCDVPTEQDIPKSHQLIQTVRKMVKKPKEIPNFSQLHQQFQQKLAQKKLKFSPTVPREFNLSQSKPKKVEEVQTPTKKLQSRHLSRAKSQPRLQSAHQKNSVQTIVAHQVRQIPTTAKFQQMVAHNRQKLRQQQLKAYQAQEQNMKRLQKQQIFARFMRKKLQKQLNRSNSLQNIIKRKTQHLKQNWHNLQKNNQEDLCTMYENVMARPFLFEISNKPNKKPMKKKTNTGWKQAKKKHIHQSPLKEFDLQHNESPPSKPNPLLPFEQNSDQRSPFVNQSF